MSVPTVRLRLDLAYDGTGFHGWAAQPGLRTVEGVITDALSTIARQAVSLTVAGRTDAGVHAAHQVAHVDIPESLWEGAAGRKTHQGEDSDSQRGRGLARRLNGLLARDYNAHAKEYVRGASDVVIHSARVVDDSFDARFSALGRRYVYRIADEYAPRNPVRRFDVLWVPGVLDLEAMRAGARLLLGEHDFLSYCRPRDGATTIRTLRRFEVHRGADGIVNADVEADAFCHSMVRSLVGAALEVGHHRRDASWMGSLVNARTRQNAAPVVASCGLTLVGVDYPEEAQWAARARAARQRRV
ncbi:MAG: tRNA pseudouridine(38-40) synthase TruA [Actinobacteria bacterium]|nr:MAG: tRNA pseudouridine(38-40) synthase TruA [Actinomycetota bacterium]